MKKVNLSQLPKLGITWLPKSVSNAKSGREVMPDGRIKYWIQHEILDGISPEMLVWWFKHLEGDILFEGQTFNRYRVWHPEDHVHVSYEKKLSDGSVGPGAELRIVEYLGRQKKYIVNVVSPIEKLDETGFIHNPRLYGFLPIARMEYAFKKMENGTFYENCLIVGWKGFSFRILQPIFEFLFFDSKHGMAWIKHNIEEVGQFEKFLPELYQKERIL